MNKENKKIKFNIILFLILIATIIVIGVVVSIKLIHKKERPEQTQEGEIQVENIGLIDMSNRENAKIEEKKKINNSESLSKDKEISNLDSLKLTNIQLLAENGVSTFSATITNTSNKDFKEQYALLQFVDKNGEEYTELDVFIPKLKAGKSELISSSTSSDIINAYDFTIKLKK